MSEIVDLVKKGATVELQEQIMNLRQSALDLQAENLDLKKQVKELQENLAKKGDLVFESGVYWLQGENGREGPFCQRCQDVEGNLVRLHAGLGKDALGMWNNTANCRQCKSQHAGIVVEGHPV